MFFLANTPYTSTVTSETDNYSNAENVVTDEAGSFMYFLPLLGEYRPDYAIVVTDSTDTTVASTTFTDTPSIPNTNITICHWDEGQGGKYTENPVSINSISKCESVNGHGTHDDDIIPSYTYGSCSYPGKNYDTTYNQAFLANGCKAPSDLKIEKTNNLVSSTGSINQTFIWSLKVTNIGSADARFNENEVVITDELPISGLTYGTPYISVHNNIDHENDLICSISSKVLTCKVKNDKHVVFNPSSYLTVSFNVTATASGMYTNPKTGGVCNVDSGNNIIEGDESNNTCSDTITISSPKGSIKIIKNTVDSDGSFGITATGGISPFTITTSSNTGSQTFSDIATGTYTFTEDAPASGWALTGVSCTGANSSSSWNKNASPNISIVLKANESVVCTFTNTYTPPCNDRDEDGICDSDDNCASVANSDQSDSDSDGIGDVCDNCRSTANPDQSDSDNDMLGNVCDNCASVANSNQQDDDGDGIGNACDAIVCGDGFAQGDESCDDGNTVNTDSCTNACEIASSGDGYIQSEEYCDDGNVIDGDGCDSSCQTESKVTICHATSENSSHDYNEQDVSINSVASAIDWLSGHGGHSDDIWPAFTAKNGDAISAYGDQPTLNNHCVEPTPDCTEIQYLGNDNECHDKTPVCTDETANNYEEVTSTTYSDEEACEYNPTLTISKSNDASTDKTPGSSVNFIIKLHVSSAQANSLTVEDLLPSGFVYRIGSYHATVNGLPVTISEPTYHSPGTWSLGDVPEGADVILTYTADISSSQDPGLYTDLAWAVANEDIYASGVDSKFIAENFVGTEVNVVKSQTKDDTYDVEKKETKIGEVLGATTTLPATGASTYWIILAMIGLTMGIKLLRSSKSK
ncbi:MAG TPA: DUF4215 domain-containing protein [Candidatus Woesebacteria bacterium]|nr:DUF4215 domain-containing protein [Candidatus Woesebacteria bacterium]